MSAAELLPWANLLLVPVLRLLWRIDTQLAAVTATQKAHAQRLAALEGRQHAAG